MNDVFNRLLHLMRHGQYPHPSIQRPVQKVPKVKDMNERQLKAHRKRQRRIQRNKELAVCGGFERKP